MSILQENVRILNKMVCGILNECVDKKSVEGYSYVPEDSGICILGYRIKLRNDFFLNLRIIHNPNKSTREVYSRSRYVVLRISKLDYESLSHVIVPQIERRKSGIEREEKFISLIATVLESENTRGDITILAIHKTSSYWDRRGIDFKVVCLKDYAVRMNDIPLQVKGPGGQQTHIQRHGEIPSICLGREVGDEIIIENFWKIVSQYSKGQVSHL